MIVSACKLFNLKFVLAPLVFLFVCSGNTAAAPQEDRAAAPQALTTTEKDQVEIGVTVYNSNIALIRDVRQIRLARVCVSSSL